MPAGTTIVLPVAVFHWYRMPSESPMKTRSPIAAIDVTTRRSTYVTVQCGAVTGRFFTPRSVTVIDPSRPSDTAKQKAACVPGPPSSLVPLDPEPRPLDTRL